MLFLRLWKLGVPICMVSMNNSPMRVEILWQEKPRVRKESLVPNQREITLYSLFIWQIPLFESVKCQQFVACNILCQTDVYWHYFFSAVCFERNAADVCVRISVRKRNCKTSWPSQTVMNSGGKSEKMLMKSEKATKREAQQHFRGPRVENVFIVIFLRISEDWTGSTRFQVLRAGLHQGYKWINGRLTKIRQTTRPHSI